MRTLRTAIAAELKAGRITNAIKMLKDKGVELRGVTKCGKVTKKIDIEDVPLEGQKELLKKFAKQEESIAPAAKNPKAPSAEAPGKTVLGSHPHYLNLADELGARRFNIPPHIWEKMTPAQRWAANTKFLDRMIARGDQIILSNSGHAAQRGTSFFKEIQYLLGKGYKLSDDGLRMIPPGQ